MKLNQKSNKSAQVSNVLVFGKSGSSGYPVSQNIDGTLSRKVNCFGSQIHDINSTFTIKDGKPEGFPVGLPKSLQASWFFTWVSGLDLNANKLVPMNASQTHAAFQPVSGVTIGGKPVAGIEKTAFDAVHKQAQKYPAQLAVLLPNGNIADGLVRHPALNRHAHLALAGLPVPTATKPIAKPSKPVATAKPVAKPIKSTAKPVAPKPVKSTGKPIAKKF